MTPQNAQGGAARVSAAQAPTAAAISRRVRLPRRAAACAWGAAAAACARSIATRVTSHDANERVQASERDEHQKLKAYVERAAAAATAAAALGGSTGPLRGCAGWRDSDACASCCERFDVPATPPGITVHAATVAGSRAGGARPNQDAFGLAPGVAAGRLLLAGVYDGHGPQGHYISRHVRDRLPAWISACATDAADAPKEHPELPAWVLRTTSAYTLAEDAAATQSHASSTHALPVRVAAGAMPPGAPAWANAAARAFMELDADLVAGRSVLLSASRVSADNSGCTAVCALLGDGHALVAAAGDSAAFLAQELPPPAHGGADAAADGAAPRPRYCARLLTLPHKPSGEEANRVRLAGGRVAAYPGEDHIPRVWPREGDVRPGRAAYGLAVSRAFGDTHWKNAGVCAAPDILLRKLAPQDAFLLLCSDGVTDAISGDDAVQTAAEALHAVGAAGDAAANAAAAVNAAAVAAWASRFPRHGRDDITTVVVLLRPVTQLSAAAAAAAPAVEEAVPGVEDAVPAAGGE
jgi:serine/threonine protein phosphatase PrpC